MFVGWYNTEHRHSRIRFVTPEQRHRGDTANSAARHALYEAAKAKRLERRSGATRAWQPIKSVILNQKRSLLLRQRDAND
jgi:putative transposase